MGRHWRYSIMVVAMFITMVMFPSFPSQWVGSSGMDGPSQSLHPMVDRREAPDYRQTNLHHFSTMHQDMDSMPNDIWSTTYTDNPAEAAMIPLAGWLVEHDSNLRDDAIRQLDYAWEQCQTGPNMNMPLNTKGYVSPDLNSRFITSNYVAFKVLGNDTFLQRAQDCAMTMASSLNRSSHLVSGQQVSTFYERYTKVSSTYVENATTLKVIPEMNARVGVAYSLLYHEPVSLYYHNNTFQTIALAELNASMVLQNMTTGSIPRHEDHMLEAATANGSSCAMQLAWAERLWGYPTLTTAVKRASSWLLQWMSPDHISERFTPTHTLNAPDPMELWWRIPVLFSCGVETSNFTKEVCYGPSGYNTSRLDWSFCSFNVMGIPSSVYLMDYDRFTTEGTDVQGHTVYTSLGNGVSNPGFERSIYGDWTYNNAAIERVSPQPHMGQCSIRIRENGMIDEEDFIAQRIMVQPSTQYSLDFRYLTGSDQPAAYLRVKVEFFDGGGNPVAASQHWDEPPCLCFWNSPFFPHTFTTPTDAKEMMLKFINYNGVAGNDVLVDSVHLCLSTEESVFEDGFDHHWFDRRDLSYRMTPGGIDVSSEGGERWEQFLVSTYDFSDLQMEFQFKREEVTGGSEGDASVVFGVDETALFNRYSFEITPPPGDLDWHTYRLYVHAGMTELSLDGYVVSTTAAVSGAPLTCGRVGFLHQGNFHFAIKDLIIETLFDIPLISGWNLVSLPMVPPSNTITEIMDTIDGKYSMVRWYDPEDTNDPWKTFSPDFPAGFNDLVTISHPSGFWLKVGVVTSMTVGGQVGTRTGTEFVLTVSTYIKQGWSLLGYPSLTPTSVSDAFGNNWENRLDTVMKKAPGTNTDVVSMGPDDLLQPGEGYWVHCSQEFLWQISSS